MIRNVVDYELITKNQLQSKCLFVNNVNTIMLLQGLFNFDRALDFRLHIKKIIAFIWLENMCGYIRCFDVPTLRTAHRIHWSNEQTTNIMRLCLAET